MKKGAAMNTPAVPKSNKIQTIQAKRGRPYKAPEEKLHRIEGWLPVHLIEWIREMGGSRFFRTIVEEAYEHKE